MVVIPAILTKKILKDFHTGHPGMSRMKAFTWSYVYWPGMDKDIENMGKLCKSCTSVARASPIKFNPGPKTDKPWSRLHIDYAFPIKGRYFFCHSRQLYEMARSFQMQKAYEKNKNTKVLQKLFARFGLPETMVSDNGSLFTRIPIYLSNNTLSKY